jgi:hypothetical protein
MPVGVIHFGRISPLAKDHSISSAERIAAANLVDGAATQRERHLSVVTVGGRVASGPGIGDQEID